MPQVGQQLGTKRRRAEYLDYLRSLGEGPECEPWRFSVLRDTYPTVRYHGGRGHTTAHRWVYEQVVGPVPDGWVVAHRCDNPPCVRPSHLFAATQGDNLRDAYQKGRKVSTRHALPGEKHPGAKLTAIEIVRIRRLHELGVSQSLLGKAFGVARSQISNIVHRTSWSTVE